MGLLSSISEVVKGGLNPIKGIQSKGGVLTGLPIGKALEGKEKYLIAGPAAAIPGVGGFIDQGITDAGRFGRQPLIPGTGTKIWHLIPAAAAAYFAGPAIAGAMGGAGGAAGGGAAGGTSSSGGLLSGFLGKLGTLSSLTNAAQSMAPQQQPPQYAGDYQKYQQDYINYQNQGFPTQPAQNPYTMMLLANQNRGY